MNESKPEILFTTSTISSGNMSCKFGDDAAVMENRKNFLAANGVPYNKHICMACDHGETITPVNWNNQEIGAETQAAMIQAEVLATDEPGLALMLLTADCLPIGFYDPVQKVIALGHMSRVTTSKLLAEKTVDFLHTEYGTNPTDLRVIVGPYIHAGSYCFRSPLQNVHETLTGYIRYYEDTACVDLRAANVEQLTKSGVPEAHITSSPIDTYASKAHYSHFRSKETGETEGRIATILMLQ